MYNFEFMGNPDSPKYSDVEMFAAYCLVRSFTKSGATEESYVKDLANIAPEEKARGFWKKLKKQSFHNLCEQQQRMYQILHDIQRIKEAHGG